MPFDSLGLRQALLQIESELLRHETLAVERDQASLDMKSVLSQRDETIRS